MEVVKTGIDTLDALFTNGGLPKNNTVLVMGGPGSGKTVMGVQYIYMGAYKYNEPGVFVALQEKPSKIKEIMLNFGWDIQGMEDQKKIVMIDATTPRVAKKDIERDIMQRGFDIDSVLSHLERSVKEINAKRIVIDSLSMMSLYNQTDFETRTRLLRVSSILSEMELTSLIISEASWVEMDRAHVYSPEAFMFDGIIQLRLDPESQERRITVRKMRGAKHAIGMFRFNITDDKGIVIKP